MAAVTTWTGREANALRQALRMSVTGFAEHLGAARRTVAKWSSQGDKIHLRADMQAALDTVLARATPDVRERFEALMKAGTSGALADPATLPVRNTHSHTAARPRRVLRRPRGLPPRRRRTQNGKPGSADHGHIHREAQPEVEEEPRPHHRRVSPPRVSRARQRLPPLTAWQVRPKPVPQPGVGQCGPLAMACVGACRSRRLRLPLREEVAPQ
jgi:hypothetical protein